MKILSVVGTRPNFIKVAPIISEIEKYNDQNTEFLEQIDHVLIHTGQHYDDVMSDLFFRDLNLPKPDIFLNVGSGSHAVQTAEIMKRFEKVLLQERADIMIVVGDVNSTLACSLVASKMFYDSNGTRPLIAHVEAGLRSFDHSMPEEINRIVTDRVSDILFTTCVDANKNLLNEGIAANKIKYVGNIMIDSLVRNLEKARQNRPYDRFGVKEKEYTYVTLHRPSNVDNENSLSCIMGSLVHVSNKLPIIFAVHPRTRKNLLQFGHWAHHSNSSR